MGWWLYCLSLSPAVLPLSLSQLSSFSIIHHSPLHSNRNPTLHSHGHTDTHTAFSLTHVPAQTEAACLWIHSHKHIITGPGCHWDHGRPQGHTLHTSMGFSFERNALASHITIRFCLVWGSKGVKFFCVCVCSVFWIKTEGKHYLGSYLWSLTYSRDSLGAMGLEERLWNMIF